MLSFQIGRREAWVGRETGQILKFYRYSEWFGPLEAFLSARQDFPSCQLYGLAR